MKKNLIIHDSGLPTRQDLAKFFQIHNKFENLVTGIGYPIDYSKKVTIESIKTDKNLSINQIPCITSEDFGEYLGFIYCRLQTKECYNLGLQMVSYEGLVFPTAFFKVDCDRHSYIGRLMSCGEVIPRSNLYRIDLKEFGMNMPNLCLAEIFSENVEYEGDRIIHKVVIEECNKCLESFNSNPRQAHWLSEEGHHSRCM